MTGRDSLRDSDSLTGFWSMTGHDGVIDTAASIAPDFICIDTQHGPHLSNLTPSIFTVLAQYGVPSLVRVESNDGAMIGRALDMGADGVVIPLVETPDDARQAVDACRYAPTGRRSYGVQTRRLRRTTQADPVCWIQVETSGAVDQLTEIASVEGVDALYVGPSDLGLALHGEPAGDVEALFNGSSKHAATMMSALRAVVEACHEAKIPAGLHCGTGAAARLARAHGFRITAVGGDLSLLGHALARELSTARSADDA